jgi:hypothetical protein
MSANKRSPVLSSQPLGKDRRSWGHDKETVASECARDGRTEKGEGTDAESDYEGKDASNAGAKSGYPGASMDGVRCEIAAVPPEKKTDLYTRRISTDTAVRGQTYTHTRRHRSHRGSDARAL